MNPALDEFLADLDVSPDRASAWTRTRRYFEGLGLPWLTYGQMPVGAPTPFADHLTTTFPSWYQDYYDKAQAARIDPAARYLSRHVSPTLTGPDFVRREHHGEDVWRHHQVTREFGARSGILVPLRTSGQDRFGTFIVCGDAPGDRFRNYYRKNSHHIVMAAFFADAKITQLETAADADDVSLSPRERECLLWLCRGLRNDRIAERLGVSNKTVELHLFNARRKLGAATREQAVARALALALIAP